MITEIHDQKWHTLFLLVVRNSEKNLKEKQPVMTEFIKEFRFYNHSKYKTHCLDTLN
jgi:hypothetical protein